MVHRPKFLSELGTSILAGVVAIFSHMTLKNGSDIANVIIVIGIITIILCIVALVLLSFALAGC